MEKSWLSILTHGAFIVFGIYWVYLSLKMTFAPHQVGVLVNNPSGLCSSNEGNIGQASAVIQVRLKDGRLIEAKASPCLFCLENLRAGDAVGVTRFGSHWIVQRSPGWLGWKS